MPLQPPSSPIHTLSSVSLEAAPDLPVRIAGVLCDQINGPDLSAATLLLPGLHAVPALRRAFGIAAARRGHAVCLPPRMLTPDQLLAAALPGHTVEPFARRAERLYGLVRRQGWYQRESLWDTCAAVIALADELGEAQVAALDEGEWRRAIRAAYTRGTEHADSREARLVWEVWHAETTGPVASAASSAGDPLAPTVFTMMAMKALCDHGSGPLFVVTCAPLSRRWRQCVERYAVRDAVTLMEIAPPGWVPQVWGAVAFSGAASGAGSGAASAAGAASDAVPFAGSAHAAPASNVSEPRPASQPAAPPAAHPYLPPATLPAVRILAASSLEAEAGAVAAQVRAWLAAGITDIGLIALDTLVARRARALLERGQVLLLDEAGWRLSTTSAATAVMRWVEAVAGGLSGGAQGGLPSRTVLDWLKSPFVLDDLAPGARDEAVAAIEDAVHGNDIARIGPALRDLPGLPASAVQLVDRLLTAQTAWPRGEAGFGVWMAALDASLDHLGIRARLAADPAGAEVLVLIAHLVQVLGGGETSAEPRRQPRREQRIDRSTEQRTGHRREHRDALRASMSEWRIFLSAQFERASFRNRSIESTVVLTTLEGAQLRPFEAVLLIGADAAHLNAAAPDDLFVNAALRSTLGLTDAAARRDALHHSLACLMALTPRVAATWRRRNLDEARPLSPPLARLELARRLAGLPSGVEMVEAAALPLRAGDAAAGPTDTAGTPAPAPQAPGCLPARISVSSYAALLSCPYRFFATAILGLSEPVELEEELSKRDYGTWVHRLLKRFHDQYPLLDGVPDGVLTAALERAADQVFAPLIGFNYLSLGWKLRLVKLFPAYLAWQREREAQGWRFEEGEAARALAIGVGTDAAAATAAAAVNSAGAAASSATSVPAAPAAPGSVAREVQLAGRIDRIDRHITDGTVALIDYKTQRIDALKRRLRDGGEDAQLAGYAMFETARGNRVAEAGLASLDGDTVGLALTRIDAAAEHERAVTLLRAVEGGAPLPANGIESACRHCQVRGLCRKDYWSVAV